LTQLHETQLDPAEIAELYLKYSDALSRFLRGVLRDPLLAHDVLQSTFTKLVELGHTTREGSRKAWLFQVAYREAMAVRRRQMTGQRVLQQVARTQPETCQTGEDALIRGETIQRVRDALRDLPETQQQVVRMRVYEEKSFAQIARELGIPLGTALGRMRSALTKLRQILPGEQLD
jgi:RNA polymerase sigma-70 factor (ECF subfamily)